MKERRKSQFVGAPSGKGGQAALGGVGAPVRMELIVPNPKLKLLEQVREVMRLRHYSIRTEQCYCDWIRRYIKFHGMQSRAELSEGGGKVESFLPRSGPVQRPPVRPDPKASCG